MTEDDRVEANSFFTHHIQYPVSEKFPGGQMNHQRDVSPRLSAGGPSQHFLLLRREPGRDANLANKTGPKPGPVDPFL